MCTLSVFLHRKIRIIIAQYCKFDVCFKCSDLYLIISLKRIESRNKFLVIIVRIIIRNGNIGQISCIRIYYLYHIRRRCSASSSNRQEYEVSRIVFRNRYFYNLIVRVSCDIRAVIIYNHIIGRIFRYSLEIYLLRSSLDDYLMVLRFRVEYKVSNLFTVGISSAEVVENERRIAEATAREEGKPEGAIPRIIEGRLGGFYKDIVPL